jgi:UDP-glucose 4-epimerase
MALISNAPVLVTGGAGFIGSHLTEALVSAGFGVRVLDSLFSGSAENLEKVMGDIEFIEGDVRDRDLVRRALRGCSRVWHLAALASVPMSLDDPSLCLDVNGRGALTVFEEAARAGCQKLVYASTSAVYGDLPAPHSEGLAPRANTPYAAAKLLGENLAAFFQEQRGLPSVSLRYFNVYGPRQSPDGPDAGVIPRFVSLLSAGEAPVIYGDGSQTRDFIHVRDAVAAAVLAGERPGSSGVYNIASAEPVAISRLAEILRELCPGAREPAHLPPRPGDPPQSWGTAERAQRELGFRPKTGLRDGLKELIALAGKKRAGKKP